MGLSDNLVVMASVIMSDVYSSNPMSPLPQILSMQPHNFPSPKSHNLFSYLFHSFNPKPWRARGAADSSCVFWRDSRDRWPHVQWKNHHHPSSQNWIWEQQWQVCEPSLVLHFYLLSLCVLYTCLKFMWVVDKILARFGGWCFFFFSPFYVVGVVLVSTVKHEIF